jgi:serine/threonine protein kinase/TolB-like protein/Tfp pilus assembly protein PilF
MTGDQWQAVKRIAADALELSESERAAFVRSRCGADASLYRDVQSLLRSAAKATDLFETPRLSAVGLREVLTEAESAAGSLLGRHIGPYRLVAEIGRGGMGAAFLAERADEAFSKRVAVKLIKRGMDTDAILRRFLHERQILANLNHPNIATLLDGGTTDDGLPYFIMEYVDGLPIDVFCDSRQLPVRERLVLFQAVCAAVHHAHENRVVHRDLKPANILVTTRGVPKLLDFGIAKLLDPERGLHTGDGGAIVRAMTPEYASPEQIRGEAVTPSTDVYSLGVLLYELLTGRHPQPTAGRTPLETERVICEEVPPPPSTVVDDDASRTRNAKADILRRGLSGDLDAIVLTALQKMPGRRYASARALSDDIQRHLEGRPIAARLDGFGTRLARQLARRKGLVAAAALLVVALIAVASWYPRPRDRRTATPQIGSIAVLPLSTSGGELADLEYLADGITENLIRRLSRVRDLKVIARDSVYRYAGKKIDARQVGRELGVQAILTGNVAHRGTAVSLTAELVDVSDGSQLWGQRYDRAITDVQFMQAELAQHIARGLRVQVSSDERTRVARSDSVNPEAYQLYLRGRYFWNKRTVNDFRKSVSYFSQAVDKEPTFALAYAGLADSYGLLTEYHAAPARETYTPAKTAVTRALALEDDLAEAHTSLAYLKQFYEWDWVGAEAEYKRALELDPDYATAHQWYAEYLSAMGRHDEALAEIRRAEDVDPLSLIVNSVHANILHLARRYDDSIQMCLRVIEMNPYFPEVYEYLKRSYAQKGQYPESIDARQTRRRILGLDAQDTPALRAAAAATSSRRYWQQRLAQELAESKNEGLRSFEMAEILAMAGDPARALDWLEKSCLDNDFMIMSIRVAPTLDPLRPDPRFKALLARSCRVPTSLGSAELRRGKPAEFPQSSTIWPVRTLWSAASTMRRLLTASFM